MKYVFNCLILSVGIFTWTTSANQTQPGDNRKFTLSQATIDALVDSMVLVKGGSFEMGSDEKDARSHEKPKHKVILDSFYIGKTEVTQAVFEELMGWNYSYYPCENCPINNVSWMNIKLFLKRLNAATGIGFRLPTEAEWEYAARGGTKSKGFKFSGSNNIDEVAWFASNSKNKLYPVAQKKPNELGLYDMTGNVWELCEDDYSQSFYSRSPEKNPVYISSGDTQIVSLKITRGGGYEFSADESVVTRRDAATSNVRMPDIGFRLVMPVESKSD